MVIAISKVDHVLTSAMMLPSHSSFCVDARLARIDNLKYLDHWAAQCADLTYGLQKWKLEIPPCRSGWLESTGKVGLVRERKRSAFPVRSYGCALESVLGTEKGGCYYCCAAIQVLIHSSRLREAALKTFRASLQCAMGEKKRGKERGEGPWILQQ